MKKQLYTPLLLQVFLLLFGCGQLFALCQQGFAINDNNFQPQQQYSDNVTDADEQGENFATLSAPVDEGTHMIHTLIGEKEIEEETLSNEFLAAALHYIIVKNTDADETLFENVSPADSHNTFAAASFRYWQPILQVFRL